MLNKLWHKNSNRAGHFPKLSTNGIIAYRETRILEQQELTVTVVKVSEVNVPELINSLVSGKNRAVINSPLHQVRITSDDTRGSFSLFWDR